MLWSGWCMNPQNSWLDILTPKDDGIRKRGPLGGA